MLLLRTLGVFRGLSTNSVIYEGCPKSLSSDASNFWGVLKRDWVLLGEIVALATVVATTQYSVSVLNNILL